MTPSSFARDLSESRDEHRSLVLAPIERLIAPAIVLPSQLAPVQTRVPEDDGPRRLMLAVLRDAIHTLTVVRARCGPEDREDVREAELWVASSARDHLFAFERICEELEIDPAYIRRGLAAWAAGMRPFLRRRRRRRRPGTRPLTTSAPSTRPPALEARGARAG